MQTVHHTLRTIKISALALIASVGLSACLPDQIDMGEFEDSNKFQTTQSEMYANALIQYATKAQAALLEDGAWQAIADGTLNFGTGALSDVRMGGSEMYVASALCKNRSDAMHLTWFEAANNDGQLALKGLGRGNGADLMGTLSRTVAGEQLAVMTAADGLRVTSTGASVAIPGSCGSLNIPDGSPVMVFALSEAEDVDRLGDVVSYEYRTQACATGEDGNLLQRRSVTYEEGRNDAVYGGWNQVENNCRAEVANEDLDIADVINVDEGLDAGSLSMLNASGSIGQQIRGALKDTECQDVKGRESQEGFDTCADASAMADLNVLDEIREPSSDTLEQYSQSCGGVLGTEANNLWNKFYGTNTYQPWNGVVVFERVLTAYRTDSDLNDSSNDDLTYKRGPWYGKTINCNRSEQLRLSCGNVSKPSISGSGQALYKTGSYVPTGASLPWISRWLGNWVGCYFGCKKDYVITFTYINQRHYDGLITGIQDGVYLSRTNNINTWANTTTMVPGNPSNPNWYLPESGKRCIWTKKEPALTCDTSGNTSWAAHYGKDTDSSPTTANRFKSGSAYTYAFNAPAHGLQSYSLVSTLNGYPRTDGLIVTTFNPTLDGQYLRNGSGYATHAGVPSKYVTHIHFAYTECSWGPSGPDCNRHTLVNSPVYRTAIQARSVASSEMAKRYRQHKIFNGLPFTNSTQGAAVDAALNGVSASTYNPDHGRVRRSYQTCHKNRSGWHCTTHYYWVSVKRPNFVTGTEFVYSVLVSPGKRDYNYMPRLNTGAQVIDTVPVIQPTGDYMLCSQQRISRSNDGFYTMYDIRGYRGVGPGANGDHSPWRSYSKSMPY